VAGFRKHATIAATKIEESLARPKIGQSECRLDIFGDRPGEKGPEVR
jgi:hypothetical protein